MVDDPIGAGRIELPGGFDCYTFDAAAGEEVVFDVLFVNAALESFCVEAVIRWQCTDAEDAFVFGPESMNNGSFISRTLALGGPYTIRVVGDPVVTGTYSFGVFTIEIVASVIDEFEISLGDVVALDSPEPGAGNLETPGSRDTYTFTADPGDMVYFDALPPSSGPQWDCIDEDGAVLFRRGLFSNSDPGLLELTRGGTYTITVEGTAGPYGFELLIPPPAEMFNVAINSSVSDGNIFFFGEGGGNVPSPGAGNIENPAAVDIYTFNAPANAVVYFDALQSNDFRIQWQCDGLFPCGECPPIVEIVFPQQALLPFSDPSPVTGEFGRAVLLNGGSYEVTVSGGGAAGGTYAFGLLGAPGLPDPSLIALDTPVVDTISEPGEVDLYRFTSPSSGEVYFDALATDTFTAQWQCDPVGPGAPGFGSRQFNPFSDPGAVSLTPDTLYEITVFSRSGFPGDSYEFAVLDLTNADDFFDLILPSNVSDGTINGDNSQVGAGNIETPVSIDEYSFTPETDQYVYFRVQDDSSSLTWTCFAPDAETVFAPQPFFDGDPGPFLLTGGTEYFIEVETRFSSDPGGTYAFSVFPPSVEEFMISIGDVIDVDTPEDDMGLLDAGVGTSDVFTFTPAAPFQFVIFDPTSASTPDVSWTLVDPNGVVVFGPRSMVFGGRQFRTLNTVGTYTLTVYNAGLGETQETYSFTTQLFNDSCENSFCAFNGLFFDNTDATSDDLSQCAVENDLWYEFVAPCTGDLTVSTCGGAQFDTFLAVYEGCDCPPENLAGCSDDFCDLQSEVTIPVTAGSCFKIRVGGFEEDTEVGPGTLSISCADPNDDQ